MQVVQTATSDRLTDAALMLMDAAREASKEAPGYVPGPNVAEATALAVQALFLADRWHEGVHGSKISLQRDETMARVRGLGMGVGCALGSIENEEGRSSAVVSFVSCFSTWLKRRTAMRGRAA